MKRVQLVRIYFLDSVSNPMDSLYTGNPLTDTLAKSEDQDEMQHNAAFHPGLHFW